MLEGSKTCFRYGIDQKGSYESLEGAKALEARHLSTCYTVVDVEFHKIHFNSTKNTSATLTFVRNNFASKIRLVRKYLKGPEVQNIINGLWTVLG